MDPFTGLRIPGLDPDDPAPDLEPALFDKDYESLRSHKTVEIKAQKLRYPKEPVYSTSLVKESVLRIRIWDPMSF
jgi:hypothetical protein